mgnify:CR=1 FL=1
MFVGRDESPIDSITNELKETIYEDYERTVIEKPDATVI